MSKKTVESSSSDIAYHPNTQTFSLLTPEKEMALAKQIEQHYKKILWIAVKFPNALDVLHTHFQQVIEGKAKLNTFVSGLSFEEHALHAKNPTYTLKILQNKMMSLSLLQSLLKEQIKVFGEDHKTTLDTQKSLAEYLNTFKWTSLMIERLVEAILASSGDSGTPPNIKLAFKNFKAAKKELFEASLRLVFAIAKKYYSEGLDYAELIREGNLGLTKAIARFQPRFGYSFSHYATWWIKHEILSFVAKQKFGFSLSSKNKAVATDRGFVSAQHLSDMTHQALSCLLPIEAAILKKRFDIKTDSVGTEITLYFNISKKALCRIEAKALKALTQAESTKKQEP